MQGKLIALKEEVLRVMARGHVKEDVYDAVSRAFDRHEAEQGEGLRAERCPWWNGKVGIENICGGKVGGSKECLKYKDGDCLRVYPYPTPTKPTEPLAVLADRKGIRRFQYDVYGDNTWSIYLNKDEENGHWVEKEFYASTYALAEAKARAYLMALDEKEGV